MTSNAIFAKKLIRSRQAAMESGRLSRQRSRAMGMAARKKRAESIPLKPR
jgi:hypothetical protein